MARTVWDYENKFQSKAVPAIQGYVLLNMNSWDPSPIYVTSAVRVFLLLISLSIFSDRRSLKIENENNSKTKMQKFENRSLIHETTGTQE